MDLAGAENQGFYRITFQWIILNLSQLGLLTMKNAKFCLFACIAILCFPSLAQAQGDSNFARTYAEDPVKLNVNSGKAPLKVEVLAPAELLTRGKTWNGYRSIGGCGFHIDWGDGNHDPHFESTYNRAEFGKHTYTVPGKYIIRAALYSPGPDDGPIYSWRGEGVVEVTGAPIAKSGISVHSPLGGEVYNYQVFPELKFALATERAGRLKMFLLDPDNNVIGEDEIRSISFNSQEISHNFRPRSYDKYDRALMDKKTRCKIELKLIAEYGTILAQTFTPSFQISPVYVSPFGGLQQMNKPLMEHGTWGAQILPARPPSKNPLEITICHAKMGNLDYSSYILDWGDGSAPEKVIKPLPQGSVHYDLVPKEFTHVYPKPGTYEIKFKSNNTDLFKSLDQIALIETLTVTVGKTTMMPSCE